MHKPTSSGDTPSETTNVTSGCVPPRYQEEFVARIRKANADWRADVLKIQEEDVEFASRLLQCVNPGEAVAICREWMASRIESATAMQRRFLDIWREAAGDTNPAKSNGNSVQHKLHRE